MRNAQGVRSIVALLMVSALGFAACTAPSYAVRRDLTGRVTQVNPGGRSVVVVEWRADGTTAETKFFVNNITKIQTPAGPATIHDLRSGQLVEAEIERDSDGTSWYAKKISVKPQ